MSKELTNYQTLLKAKSNIITNFDEKKKQIKTKAGLKDTLVGNDYKGSAANVYDDVTNTMLNKISALEAKALEKLDQDIETWHNQLSDAEKIAAKEYEDKIIRG